VSDENTLGGRLARYARVGTAVGGLAARLAGGRVLGLPLDQERHAAQLRAALGGLKGPLMKVAQMMSTLPDALPDAYVRELAELQANAPSMGWPFVKRRMATELGADWQSRFTRFPHEAAAAASLGQVHRATLKDGSEVACKLQYPDMTAVVEADLRQLKLVFALYERLDRAIVTERIHQEISERLREELDYRREARHMRLYRHMLAKEEGIAVPEPIDNLSTGRLLTMSWIEGVRLTEIADASLEVRNQTALRLFRAWYVPFYGYGVIHGDPHLGNYTRASDGTLNLLDFGCIRVFKPSFVRGVIELYRALRDGDENLAVEAYRIWGFETLSREVIDVLNLWARFVYAPLMEDRSRAIQEGGGTAYGRQVATKVHAELRRLGGIAPPREFVLMDRAAVGLGAVFLRLKAEINWFALFRDLIGDFDEAVLARRQREALAAAGLGDSLPES
jgi:predicted unusual protein kinase regulating ubiquinone biosynthesis (AarF/ABC1/UbiB family)